MANSSSEFRTQWSEPSDIFSLLLILGGDVIQCALASPLTPVAFSFGWVSYAVTGMLTSAVQTSLPPNPEIPVSVCNLQNGYSRMNESWLLSRLVKTYERWMPDELKNAINDPDAFGNRPRTLRNKEPFPLYVTIYGWDLKKRNPGIPQRDWVWWSGFVVTVVQLGISSIPFALYGYWSVFLITACGSTLALAFSAIPGLTTLPQARAGKRPVALTSLRENGNGHQHVIIILGNEAGLDLLRLASNQLHVTTTVKVVRLMIGTLWILLLITSTAIQTRTWYLVGVGFLGMSHNLFLSAVPRQPKALGMPIQLKRWCNGDEETTIEAGYPRGEAQIIAEETTMFTLMRLELRYPRFGSLLVREIFPGRLSTWEDEWWTSYDKKERERILAAKIKEFINAKIRTRTIVID